MNQFLFAHAIEFSEAAEQTEDRLFQRKHMQSRVQLITLLVDFIKPQPGKGHYKKTQDGVTWEIDLTYVEKKFRMYVSNRFNKYLFHLQPRIAAADNDTSDDQEESVVGERRQVMEQAPPKADQSLDNFSFCLSSSQQDVEIRSLSPSFNTPSISASSTSNNTTSSHGKPSPKAIKQASNIPSSITNIATVQQLEEEENHGLLQTDDLFTIAPSSSDATSPPPPNHGRSIDDSN